tara:strand:- start:1069 stop:1227 length:159 start_codon:yes stop_codon:yes gene_type:complete
MIFNIINFFKSYPGDAPIIQLQVAQLLFKKILSIDIRDKGNNQKCSQFLKKK